MTWLTRLRAWLDAHARCRELERQLAARDEQLDTLRASLAKRRESESFPENSLEARLNNKLSSAKGATK